MATFVNFKSKWLYRGWFEINKSCAKKGTHPCCNTDYDNDTEIEENLTVDQSGNWIWFSNNCNRVVLWKPKSWLYRRYNMKWTTYNKGFFAQILTIFKTIRDGHTIWTILSGPYHIIYINQGSKSRQKSCTISFTTKVVND